jgi:hypothetical protein
MLNDRLFVLQVVVAIEEQWFADSREGPPTRTARKHRIDDSLFAAADEDDAFQIASEWLANDGFSDSNHDGEGDLTRIFAVGIHQLEEVARIGELREKAQELYGIALPGFYLGDVDVSGVPVVRQKEELEVFRLRRLFHGGSAAISPANAPDRAGD